MNPALSGWAQDLANEGRDYFALRGRLFRLSGAEVGRDVDDAREVINGISAVTSRGEKYTRPQVDLRVRGTEFAVDLSVVTQDAAGRDSRVTIHGSLPLTLNEEFAAGLIAAAEAFSEFADRRLDPRCRPQLAEMFDALKKKSMGEASRRRMIVIGLVVAAVVLVGLFIGLWLG